MVRFKVMFVEAFSLEHVGWGRAVNRLPKTGLWGMTWGTESHLLPQITGTGPTGEGNWDLLGKHIHSCVPCGKSDLSPAQAPFQPTASWSRQAGGGGPWLGGGRGT